MRKFEKYQQNLKYDNNFIYSYDTKVALIDRAQGTIVRVSWDVDGKTSSPTTTRHINYAAKELKLQLLQFNFQNNK